MKFSNIQLVIYVVLIEVLTTWGSHITTYIVLLATLFYVSLNIKRNAHYLLVLLLVSDDQGRFLSSPGLNEIYTVYTAPNVMVFFTVAVFLLSIKNFIQWWNYWPRGIKRLVRGLVGLLLIGTVMGGVKILSYPRVAIQDMSYFINPLSYIMALSLILTKRATSAGMSIRLDYLEKVLDSILLAISVKYLLLLYLFVTGNGEVVGNMVKVTGESGKSLMPVYAAVFLSRYILLKSWIRMFNLFMFLVTTLLIFSVASRSTMIFFVLSTLFVLLAIEVSKTKRVFLISLSVLFLFISVFTIELLHKGALNNVLWKLSSITEIDINAARHTSLSALTRYIELINIYYLHLQDYTLFFGQGFASYFVDDFVKFPFDLYGKHAYPDEWIANRTFFKPHTTPIFLFLKIGILGTVFYYCIFIKIFTRCKAVINRKNSIALYVYAISILPNVFLMITKNYSSKMQILTGVFVLMLLLLSNNESKNESRTLENIRDNIQE